jgi:hypothetical protein
LILKSQEEHRQNAVFLCRDNHLIPITDSRYKLIDQVTIALNGLSGYSAQKLTRIVIKCHRALLPLHRVNLSWPIGRCSQYATRPVSLY